MQIHTTKTVFHVEDWSHVNISLPEGMTGGHDLVRKRKAIYEGSGR